MLAVVKGGEACVNVSVQGWRPPNDGDENPKSRTRSARFPGKHTILVFFKDVRISALRDG